MADDRRIIHGQLLQGAPLHSSLARVRGYLPYAAVRQLHFYGGKSGFEIAQAPSALPYSYTS